MTVLVTGGRGTIARAAVAGLRAAGEPVRVGGRVPAALDDPDAVLVDLTRPETFPPALDGVDRLLLYAEPAGIDAFVAAAEEAGVRQVVVVSSLSVLGPPGDAIADKHRVVEDAVGAASFASTFLRPGGFAGNARQWLGAITGDGEVRLPYPDSGEAPVDERDVADVAVTVLRAGPNAGFDGTAPSLTGPESMTRRAEVERLAAALGRDVQVVELDRDHARRELGAALPAHVVDSLLDYWALSDGKQAEVSLEGPRITGTPGRTFAQWAGEVAATR